MNANAANFDPTGGSSGYPQQQQQPQGDINPYYPPDDGGYYDEATAAASYPDAYYPSMNTHADYTAETVAATRVPGYYYPTTQHYLSPEVYGAPVSALAYDKQHACIYVASHTTYMSSECSSMLVTHSTLDGMLYSSCAGHPEAPIASLKAVYEAMYGGGVVAAASGANDGLPRTKVPQHAYRPPYGSRASLNPVVQPQPHSQSQHLGITTLLPLQGYVASVSPSAVRIHSHGGLCIADNEIQGMICGTPNPSDQSMSATHMTVGGRSMMNKKYNSTTVHCFDLYQGLRTVSSNTFTSATSTEDTPMAVMSLATNGQKQNLAAGCSDGTIRLLDSRRRGGELAKIKSHAGGTTQVAVSPDGNLLCSTGFAARPSATAISGLAPLFAYPDQLLLVYDVRYLGRGGFVHSFSGLGGGPRLISFLPDMQDQPANRVLVASGQRKGGLQIVVPFDNEASQDPANFWVPQLGEGESLTSLCISDECLAIGTSSSQVLQYELEGFDKSNGYYEKEPLVVPNYTPELPAASIVPTALRSVSLGASRNNPSDKINSIFGAYTLCSEPTASVIDNTTAFGKFAESVLLASSKRNVSATLTKTTQGNYSQSTIAYVPAPQLEIKSLLDDHSVASSRNDKQKIHSTPLLNPNKMLYTKKISERCFDADNNLRQLSKHRNDRFVSKNNRGGPEDDRETKIPARYRQTMRPSYVGGSHFEYAKYNQSLLWPGWDYSMAMPNAFAVSVLMLIYFEPHVRWAMLSRQFDQKLFFICDKSPSLTMELGFLFHQIENISRFARTYPSDGTESRLGALTPVNFITSFATMPEAEALALLDGTPGAVHVARRPEAFYRFLLHHLDKELSALKKSDKMKSESKLMDSLNGINFLSANEFITEECPPEVTMQRSLTVDLAYEPFLKGGSGSSNSASFGQVLRHALCRESRLRAWSKTSKAYKTIIQRKIATSLPLILSLSCSCAGRKEEEGLSIWRGSKSENGHWLPEIIEVELEDDGNVVVREFIEKADSDEKEWSTVADTSAIPAAIAEIISKNQDSIKKRTYRLDAVLSFVRDDMDPSMEEQLPDSISEKTKGHHVLHVREPSAYKLRALSSQRKEVDHLVMEQESESDRLEGRKWTLASKTKSEILCKRSETVTHLLQNQPSPESMDSDWILFNGFVVSKTVAEDARAFHVPFKEPCLLTYRAVSEDNYSKSASRFRKGKKIVEASGEEDAADLPKIPSMVMETRSISHNQRSPYDLRAAEDLPGKGDMIAFDAEFVSVQEEESILSDTGSKVTLRETRLALARVSVIDCRTGAILVDDHVLPREPVVDYLTRFSGIVAVDLDPKSSPHHLISTRAAYLKMRYLLERGCIFLGHGLSQDFLTLNLYVPPSQIVDTVEIYHKPRMRYISLRFLTNFVLQRDMQQDVHDSVEDARAALELYRKALEFQSNGTFDSFLDQLYAFGQKSDWKLGIEES